MGPEEMRRRAEQIKAEGVPYVGYPADEPCDVCAAVNMNQTEPRFGYTVCRDHAHLSPVEVSAQREVAKLTGTAVTGRTRSNVANQNTLPKRGRNPMNLAFGGGETRPWDKHPPGSLEHSMALWEEASKDHLIHRQTLMGAVERPTGAKAKALGDFVVCPIPFLGVIFWGFKHQVDAEYFDRNYPVIKEDVRGQ